MKHTIKRDEKTGDINITVNIANNLSNTSNNSADNIADFDSDDEPKSKPFTIQLLESIAIGAATAIASMFF
jgi:hypothetical protein